jgi:hypothetical protein
MMGVIRWKGGVNFPHSEFDRLPGDRAFGDLQGISHTDTGLLGCVFVSKSAQGISHLLG